MKIYKHFKLIIGFNTVSKNYYFSKAKVLLLNYRCAFF
jgi:hypothetical protein